MKIVVAGGAAPIYLWKGISRSIRGMPADPESLGSVLVEPLKHVDEFTRRPEGSGVNRHQ